MTNFLKKSKILICDDHAIIRMGLKTLISENPEWELAGEIADLSQLKDAIAEKNLDLVIVDYFMPGGNGLEYMLAERRKYPRVKTIVFTNLQDVALQNLV